MLARPRTPLELQRDIETVLSDSTRKLFLYARWSLSDYITGTAGMSLEHEGCYMRFLARLYDRGKPFPDDDKFMCAVLGLSIRVWRRLKAALISIGKISAENGTLTNARFERERRKRAEELHRKAEGAKKRWEHHRANQRVSPKFDESFDETSAKLDANVDEKPNEINDAADNNQRNARVLRVYKEEGLPNGSMSSAQLPLLPDDPSPPDRPATSKKSETAGAAFELYNQTAARCGLPVARVLGNARKAALLNRVKDAGGLDGFREAMLKIEGSAFLRGKNDRNWRADLGFVCQAASFAKILEGAYGGGATISGGGGTGDMFRYAPELDPYGNPYPDYVRIMSENDSRKSRGEPLMEEPEYA